MIFRIILLSLFGAVTTAVRAADTLEIDTITQTESDSIIVMKCDSVCFKPTQLVVPGALITLGALGTISNWGQKADPFHKRTTPQWHRLKMLHPDKWIQFVPSAFGIGLNVCGVKSPYTRSERLMLRATSLALCASLTFTLKHVVREKRPNGTDRHAFPSGHTSTAFQGAELVRMEYGGWYGVAAYAMATGVAIERVVYDKHWLHDAVAGAGIGILCARASLWLLPLEKKLFRGIGKKRAVAFIPYYDASQKAVGGSLAVTF